MNQNSVTMLSAKVHEILDSVAKSLKLLLQLSAKYKHVDANVSLLIGYFASIQASVNRISALIENSSKISLHRDVTESLGTTLECTSLAIVFLEARVTALGCPNDLGKFDTPLVLFTASEFEMYLESVGSSVNALNLQLSLLQSQEQLNALYSREAQSILEDLETKMSALLHIKDSTSVPSQQYKLPENSAVLSLESSLGSGYVNPRTNQIAHRYQLTQALVSDEAGGHEEEHPPSYEESTDITYGLAGEYRPEPREGLANTPNSILPHQIRQKSKHLPFSLLLCGQGNVLSVLLKRALRNGTFIGGWSIRILRQYYKAALPRRANMGNASERLPGVRPSSSLEPNNRKVIVLGAHDSGKTTWTKAIKLFEEGTWTAFDRELHSTTIFSNTIDNMKKVLQAMESWEMPLESKDNMIHMFRIMSQPIELMTLPEEVVESMIALRHDKNFIAALKRKNEYHLQDHAEYFFDSVKRISQSNYLPTDEDMLRCSTMTTGITSNPYHSSGGYGPRLWTVLDPSGSRMERRRWYNVLNGISLVVFTVDMGAFDQRLVEDDMTNRIDDSVALFESVVHEESLANSKIVLCFTKQKKHANKFNFGKHETETGIITQFRDVVHQKDLPRIMVMVIPDLPTKDEWGRIKIFAASDGKANWPYWSGSVDSHSFLYEQWSSELLPSQSSDVKTSSSQHS